MIRLNNNGNRLLSLNGNRNLNRTIMIMMILNRNVMRVMMWHVAGAVNGNMEGRSGAGVHVDQSVGRRLLLRYGQR